MAKKTNSRRHPAEIKRELLELKFGKIRRTYEGFHMDNAVIFCNIYDTLMESLSIMNTIDNDLIWVAFNRQFEEEVAMLKNLAELLKK